MSLSSDPCPFLLFFLEILNISNTQTLDILLHGLYLWTWNEHKVFFAIYLDLDQE